MKAIKVLPTSFPEAKLFVPEVYEDDRGDLCETYSLENYGAFGLDDVFVQDLVTWSGKNVVRGPHYDPLMAKFVQVLVGRVYDVIVDMRSESPSYKKWEGFHLTSRNHRQLYIPAGFAHGFLTLSDEVVFHYKMTAQHKPSRERQLHWRDPAIGIRWPVVGDVRVSPKDSDPRNFL